MAVKVKFWILFGNLTDDKVPTDISFPNAAVFEQLTNNLLSSFLSFQGSNKKDKNSCILLFNSFESGFFCVVLAKLTNG